jgi:hypothetical protein
MENGSSIEMTPAPGNPQVEKRIAGSESRGLQELSRASSQTEERLNQFLTSIESLLSPSVMGHGVRRAEQVPARSRQPAGSRLRVGSMTNMPAPIADVERWERASVDFGSEELRIALLAGGERAQHVKCPKCESDNVRRSSPASFYESYMRFFFMSPYRCRKCMSRFYAKNGSDPKQRFRRLPSVLRASTAVN